MQVQGQIWSSWWPCLNWISKNPEVGSAHGSDFSTTGMNMIFPAPLNLVCMFCDLKIVLYSTSPFCSSVSMCKVEDYKALGSIVYIERA